MATCVDVINGYTCTCEGGYIGDNCETGTYNLISGFYDGEKQVIQWVMYFMPDNMGHDKNKMLIWTVDTTYIANYSLGRDDSVTGH